MSLIVLYLSTRYDVCESNSLREMTISFLRFLKHCLYEYSDLQIMMINQTRSIQRTQTPPRLWPLTLSFDFDLKVKVKNAYVIRCRLLYCTLVPGMMSMSVLVCEIWPLVHVLWPLTFACVLHRPSRWLSFSLFDGRYVVVYWFQVLSL